MKMRQSGLQSQRVLNLQVGPKDSTWENVFLDLFLEAVSYMGDSGRVINFLAGSADSLHNCEEKKTEETWTTVNYVQSKYEEVTCRSWAGQSDIILCNALLGQKGVD